MRRFLSSAPIVLTLGLGIAFNVISFSILSGLLQRPFGYAELRRLVLVRDARPTDGAHQARAISAADFFDLRSSVPAIDSLAAFRAAPLVITSAGADPERIEAVAVTANFFATLGVRPLLGRSWPDDADQAGKDRFVVLSRRLWHARFGDDRSIVGRSVALNGRAVTVAAVVADQECYPVGVDAWIPLVMTPAERADRTAQRLNGVGRLAPTASVETARGQLASIAQQLASVYPATNLQRGFDLLPLRREQYEFTAPMFGFAQAAALLVFVLGTLNVTTLLAVRWLNRSDELSIRWMLGATAADVSRLIVADVAVGTAAATAVGVAAAVPALNALRATLPEGISRWVNGWSALHVDAGAVLAGCVLGAVATAIIAAAVVATARTAIGRAASGARVTHGRPLVRRALVATQVALAAALMLCAFVTVRALDREMSAFARLAPDRLLRFVLTSPPARYADSLQLDALHARLLDSLGALPGVEMAALVRNEPASNVPSPVAAFERLDSRARTAAERPRIDVQTVSPSAFDVLRLPVIQGRAFTRGDAAATARVAIVSAGAVRRFWPDRNPVGTEISIGDDSAPVRVVGVVADFKVNWYDPGPRPTVYVPDAQSPARTVSVLIRTYTDAAALEAPVRAAMARIDPLQPVGGLEPLRTSIVDSLSPVRVIERLLLVGACVASLLAAIGVFGVLAEAVTRRLREFGVRLALGATPRGMVWLVFADAMATGAVGLGIGIAAAVGIVRAAGAQLLGLAPFDAPVALGVVSLVSALVCAAALMPALRAARVDAAALLRQ